jgi:hypothetical protein
VNTGEDRGIARITLSWIIKKQDVMLGSERNSLCNMFNAGL